MDSGGAPAPTRWARRRASSSVLPVPGAPATSSGPAPCSIARCTIPSFAVSIAVSSGPSMADVEFGFVHDFGAGEEFMAQRGEGATLNGKPVSVSAEAERLEVVGIESAEPEWSLPALEALAG